MSTSQRQKTFTARFDDETHYLLSQLAQEYGQNKTQVLKRMIREETARKDLLKRASQLNNQPNYKDLNASEDDESLEVESLPLPSCIRVTGYSGEGYWYRALIGKEFTVKGKEGTDYIVDVPEDGTHYVSMSDCEVVS